MRPAQVAWRPDARSALRQPDPRVTRRLAHAALSVPAAYAAASSGYLLALLGAAAATRSRSWAGGEARLSLAVLIPAHDEAALIAPCVRSLVEAHYPAGRHEVIVVADNCSDATAELAVATGATAWERDDPGHPGKGQALAWALERLQRERPGVEAVVMVDADCVASPELLRELAGAVEAGADAAQAAYVIANPGASTPAALRFAGFALVNLVRPLGKEALGLSCGLLGSGMAFPRATLAAVPWDAFSVTEDREYHLRLVDAGRRARFVARASVSSPAPVSAANGEVQQVRWETGNISLGRRWMGRLVRGGIARRDAQRLHAGLELTVGPLSLLVAPALAVAAGGLALRAPRLARTGQLALLGQATYVLGGLALARAPASVFRALLAAPTLVLARVCQYAHIGRGGGATAWIRTERES